MNDKEIVRKLCSIEHGLSEWEVGFVESIASRVIDNEQPLTEKQRERAMIILEKVGG